MISAADDEAYKNANKVVLQKMRRAREDLVKNQCKAIENNLNTNNSKKVYETVRVLSNSTRRKATVVNNKQGHTLAEPTKICERWREYCLELYNADLVGDTTVLTNPENFNLQEEPALMEEEVREAIWILPLNKAPGCNNIPSEIMKACPEEFIKPLTKICNTILTTKKWWKPWTSPIIVPLPKKGNLKECSNYCTISLIIHPSKVMLRILLPRLQPRIEGILAEEHAGFYNNRSTVEQIFNLRQVMERYLEHQLSPLTVFIDFKKEFDRVWQKALWVMMHSKQFTKQLIEVIKSLQNESTC